MEPRARKGKLSDRLWLLRKDLWQGLRDAGVAEW